LWGIESDSGSDYLQEVAREELADLLQHCERFGIDCTDWDSLSVREVER
jgi:hypothetical protein